MRASSLGSERMRKTLLGFALLAPGVAWFVHLSASYSLIAYACERDRIWLLHFWSGIALLAAVAGIAAGWLCYRSTQGGEPLDAPAHVPRFASVAAILLGLLFALIILAGELNNLVLEPCL